MMRLDRKAGTCTSACGEGSSACGVTTARAARARESAQCGLGLSSSGASCHDAVTLGDDCVGILALLQGTIKAKEERRGTPADGFAVAWRPLDIARSALFPLAPDRQPMSKGLHEPPSTCPRGAPGA